MTISQAIEMGRDLLATALIISLPALLVSLVVGLVVSVLQTVTSVQEQTLSFVPRLILVGLALVFCTGWLLELAVHFTVRMLGHAAGVAR